MIETLATNIHELLYTRPFDLLETRYSGTINLSAFRWQRGRVPRASWLCGSTASEHTSCPCPSGRASIRTLAIGAAPFSQAMTKTEPLIRFALIDQSKRSRLLRAVQVVPVPMISTDRKAKRTAASHGRNEFLYIPRRDEIILWGNRGSSQPLLETLPNVFFRSYMYPVAVC